MAERYVAIVFARGERARTALHALWDLDASGDITVHGAVLVKRDRAGEIEVLHKDTIPTWRTAGPGLGALVDALAGPPVPAGQDAVIGEISESWNVPLDGRMTQLGGKVYRRATSDVGNDTLDECGSVFYFYDYEPRTVETT